MNIFISVIPFLILIFQNGFVDANRQRIADGTKTEDNEFPFLVSIFNKTSDNKGRVFYQHTCGGSLITSNLVLTANHCTKPLEIIKQAYIIAGITNIKGLVVPPIDRSHQNNIRKVDPKGIFRRPHYDLKLPGQNDIAIIRVERPFDIDNVKIACVKLPKANFAYTLNSEVLVAGWGKTKASSSKPNNNLLKTTLKIIDNGVCQQKYIKKNKKILTVGAEVFCTANDNKLLNRGVCGGDSGGPALVYKNTIVGIIKGSHHPESNPQCGSKKYPDLYTRVTDFLIWIDETIKSEVKNSRIDTCTPNV